MSRTFFLLLFISLISQSLSWFYGRPDPGYMTDGGVWPLPWNESDFHNRRFVIDPGNFAFNSWHAGCEIIDKALARYKKLAFPQYKKGQNINIPTDADQLHSVTLSAKEGCTDGYPFFGMDESYTVQAMPGMSQALITANTVWGLLRGLETFSQLIYRDESQTWWAKATTIHDHPRFPHRGIMIDSSRHFLSVNILKRQIDLMAQNKMNVLHWHLVDSESFPYPSAKYPQLQANGAYTPKHIYTIAQVKDVIEFARLRGVRVIPEFDTPGHTGAWKGIPGLLSLCYDRNGVNDILENILDPTKDDTWVFLKNFFWEALDLFKDSYMHFGGDETSSYMLECWERNPKVSKWMKDNGYANTNALLKMYFQKLVQIVTSHSKNTSMIFWQEVLDMNVAPKDSIAHVWKGGTITQIMNEMKTVTAAGHKAILSSCWYLNYIKYGADWGYVDKTDIQQRGMYYECDPTGFDGTQQQKDLVMGGEAAMWGEFVDGTNITPRLWPRASAVAERLWSDPALTTSADAAWPRLHEHRCRMMARGYEAEPPNDPDYCRDYWDPQYPDMET